jgi:hypothetical protein
MFARPPTPTAGSEPAPALTREAAPPPRPWLVVHAAGAVALAIGVIGFAAIAFTQDPMWATPALRHSILLVAAAAIAAAVSLVRREGLIALPLAGVGLAAATFVLGWFLLTLAVIAGTAALILILSQVM